MFTDSDAPMPIRPCPACGQPASACVAVPAAPVWGAYAEEFGVTMPESVRHRHAPTGEWSLVTCSGCGLEHFADAPQGDAEFYRLLTRSNRYYESDRWEFGVVRRLLPARGVAVIDIGCGQGAFLRSLAPRHRRVGLDHNTTALRQLQQADPQVQVSTEDALAHASGAAVGSYDVVTAFQVLEHLEDPRALLRGAAALLASRGSAFVSIPHRDRSGRLPFEVLDHPPHHLTRWRLRQLKVLAEAEQLHVVETWFEPPDESVRMPALTAWLEARLSGLPAPATRAGVRLGRIAADSYAVRSRLVDRGFYSQRGLMGHTLLARLITG